MVTRKNIAIEDKHLKYLDPLLENNNNNFSAAVREAIEFVHLALDHFETLDDAKIHLTKGKGELSSLEETIHSGKNMIISSPTLLWFLKYTRGLLLDREILEEMLDPFKINTLLQLDKQMNTICRDFGWNVTVSLHTMDDFGPEALTLLVSNGNELMREFTALHVAQFLAYNWNMDVDVVHRRATSIRIDFKKINANAEIEKLKTIFGYNHVTLNELLKNHEYWKTMIEIHLATKYNIVSFGNNNFASVLAGKPIQDTRIIESFAKKHISDIPYLELIETIKLLHENMGVVDKIEYPDMDTIQIYHSYKDERAIHKLTDFYKYILQANGQLFNAKFSSSLIVLERIKE